MRDTGKDTTLWQRWELVLWHHICVLRHGLGS